MEACGEFGGFEAGQTAGACRWLGHAADRGVQGHVAVRVVALEAGLANDVAVRVVALEACEVFRGM